ncbi:MAG TPA: sulfatase-like hydrolase/transferase [Kiloniellales bacterium]|nr:sulfatase-like hydrolase/transferase [Kiloniellales bacterium]
MNLLILMGDEHNRDFLGCAGHPVVRTPNLDRLAERGTRFTAAYTPSPICVSARASLQCGRPVHQIGAWDSATPYRGRPESWGHRLRDAGQRCLSVGKLHFLRSEDDNGFAPELLPMHIWKGIGWVIGLLRDDPPVSTACREFAEQLGPGRSSYTDYDEKVASTAACWIAEEGSKADGPWTLFVSLTAPHYPLLVPEPFWTPYAKAELAPPAHYRNGQPRHPVLERLARCFNYDDYFDQERVLQAQRSYCGLLAFHDHNLGLVLEALAASGQADRTLVLYTSDHGESLGAHSSWAKSTMYEHSAGVPMILAGPEVPRGRVAETPVSLLDIHPTAVQAAGLRPSDAEADLPGRSLLELVTAGEPERPVISEYHDGGAITGITMLRLGRWKYVHYVDYAPQLFDLANDPTEARDLAADPAHAATLARLERELRRHLDPEGVNARAFADQAAAIERLGGREALRQVEDFGYTPLPIGGTA